MNCPNCGQEITRPGKYCVECGAALPPADQPQQQPPVQAAQPASVAPPSQAAYIRADYDPARDGRLPYQMQSPQQYPPLPQASQPFQSVIPPRPSNTGMIVFSIINMLCCGGGISFILGIIALIFAINAGSAGKQPEEAQHDLKIARIINFVGLAFVILSILAIIVLIILAAFTGSAYYWEGYIPDGTGYYR